MSLLKNLFVCFCLMLPLVACGSEPSKKDVPLLLKSSSYQNLPGWSTDSHLEALTAFQKSCTRILKNKETTQFGPKVYQSTYAPWIKTCKLLFDRDFKNSQEFQHFVESHFQPYEVRSHGKTEGLFTGYYEPSLKGSLTQQGSYQSPLYQKPKDLIMVDLGAFREDLKGRRIAGKLVDGRLKPYANRKEIDEGALQTITPELAYAQDPVDLFFLQIQGSGRLILEDETTLRVGYDGQNGHPYYAIGRELIKRGALTSQNVSLQSIRQWLTDHPDQATEVMQLNQSYVFFRQLDGDGPIGGEGVALTPERSLAIDRSRIPYGTPLFLDAQAPQGQTDRIQRLMVAQDTGGAIRGNIRGDVFCGHGDTAELNAGHMKSKGRYWLLLPKEHQIPENQRYQSFWQKIKNLIPFS